MMSGVGKQLLERHGERNCRSAETARHIDDGAAEPMRLVKTRGKQWRESVAVQARTLRTAIARPASRLGRDWAAEAGRRDPRLGRRHPPRSLDAGRIERATSFMSESTNCPDHILAAFPCADGRE